MIRGTARTNHKIHRVSSVHRSQRKPCQSLLPSISTHALRFPPEERRGTTVRQEGAQDATRRIDLPVLLRQSQKEGSFDTAE